MTQIDARLLVRRAFFDRNAARHRGYSAPGFVPGCDVKIYAQQPRGAQPHSECRERAQLSGALYCEKVLQAAMSPESRPRRNHSERSAEVPCVNDSGLTYPLAIF